MLNNGTDSFTWDAENRLLSVKNLGNGQVTSYLFDKTLREWLQRELPGFLSRPDDKELFSDLLTITPIEPASPAKVDISSASVPQPE